LTGTLNGLGNQQLRVQLRGVTSSAYTDYICSPQNGC
jgi:hypothetical protein